MSEKYTVLKKFCNNDRPANAKITAGLGVPGQCPIGAWYPGETYTGKDGVINPKEVTRLAKEGLITKGKPRYESTIDDLSEGQGIKVGHDIVTDVKPHQEEDGVINRDDEEEEDPNEPVADGEESPEEEKPVDAPPTKPRTASGRFGKRQ